MEEKSFPNTLKSCHELIKQLLEITDALAARTSESSARVEN